MAGTPETTPLPTAVETLSKEVVPSVATSQAQVFPAREWEIIFKSSNFFSNPDKAASKTCRRILVFAFLHLIAIVQKHKPICGNRMCLIHMLLTFRLKTSKTIRERETECFVMKVRNY